MVSLVHTRAPHAAGALLAAACAALVACSDDADTGTGSTPPASAVVLANHSVTPALVKNVLGGVAVHTLLSSDDTLAGSPGFVFGGTADGSGLLKNADGTFTLVVNNEDNFSVSRIRFDATFKPVSGDYLMNSDAGRWRLCSATLVTPAVHGFGPLFITAGESGTDPMIHAIDPTGAPNATKLLPGLGRWLTENAVPLPKEAYGTKTVVVIGDDDSGTQGGQLALYVGTSIGDLDNGSVYVMTKPTGVARERDFLLGQSYPVTFAKIDNQAALTSAQLNAAAVAAGAVQFGRVEDVDYRKGVGAGREIYFNVTGQNTNGANADFSRTRKGRVYKLVLDPSDPTKGTLEVVLDGDATAGPSTLLQNPDNIVATTNYLYIEEDPNEYGDETHDSYLWQYNLSTKELRPVFEIDHHRDAPDAAKFNTTGQGNYALKTSPRGSWENSGIIDVSDQLGIEGAFIVGIQAHTWRSARFAGADGGTARTGEDQGSQLLLLTGLPR